MVSESSKGKQAFRALANKTPVSVHKAATKAKLFFLTRHIMSDEDRQLCDTSVEERDAVTQKYMMRFPRQANLAEARICNALVGNENYSSQDEDAIKEIVSDMLFCWFAYGCQPDEYIFFGFDGVNKDRANREPMVSDLERLCFRFCANDFTELVYADKISAYRMLSKFYQRDVFVLESERDRSAFLSFAEHHPRFVSKSIGLSRGLGVSLVDLNDLDESADSMFDRLLAQGKVLLEEVIEQSEELRAFNSSSVNTVRLSTFLTRDGVVAPFGFFRTGRNGSFIDNCAAGGVFATIDTKSGIIISDGCDEFGNRFQKHPDSGLALNGFKLPDWDGALRLCEEAAMLTPSLKYLSWDLAHSDEHGWEIVEVNTSGQFMQQAGTLTGIRKELSDVVKRMDLLVPYVVRSY